MVVQSISTPLPDAHSPDIHLSHPTGEECLKIWELSSLAWRDAFTLPLYLEESAFLTTVPLARDGGMTIWILVDKIFFQTTDRSYAHVKVLASVRI